MTDLVEKQGSSGSDLTDLDGVTMTDLVQAFASEIGTLSVAAALSQAAFLCCCDVIAQDQAKATLQLREKLKNGTSRVLGPNDHEIAALLADEPNRRHTWFEFHEMMGLWHALMSNDYAVVFRRRDGTPDRLVPVQPAHVQEMIAGGEVYYDVTAGTNQEMALLGASFLRVPERDMIHVRGRMLNGMDGYSTLTAGRKTLQTGAAIEEYRDDLYSEGAQVRGVFERDWAQGTAAVLPEEAYRRLRSQLKLMMRKFAQDSEPIIVEGGLKFKAIASSPKDAQLTEQFEAQIVATCRLLRMPPHKVFHLVNVKYENLDTMEKAYVGDTMDPILQRHEQRYGKVLLSREDRRAGLFLEHDREALQLTDYKAETERVIRTTERGLCLINEGRARLNMQPVPWGDAFYVPVNMQMVDENGKVLIGPPAKPDPASSEDQPADQPAKDAGLRLVKG